jgi:AmiR/NasT family two-component response regulator
VIDQAIGVIMAQQRCAPADAFAILRAASQYRNIKLRQVAEQIITGITGSPLQPSTFNP